MVNNRTDAWKTDVKLLTWTWFTRGICFWWWIKRHSSPSLFTKLLKWPKWLKCSLGTPPFYFLGVSRPKGVKHFLGPIQEVHVGLVPVVIISPFISMSLKIKQSMLYFILSVQDLCINYKLWRARTKLQLTEKPWFYSWLMNNNLYMVVGP